MMVWLVYSQKLVCIYSAYLGDNYRKVDVKAFLCCVSLVAVRVEPKLRTLPVSPSTLWDWGADKVSVVLCRLGIQVKFRARLRKHITWCLATGALCSVFPSFLRHSANGFLGVMADGFENAFNGRRINARSFLLGGKAAYYLHFCFFMLTCSWLKLCPRVHTWEVPWWIPRRGEPPL